MASCTASFQETSAHVGDTIHADFTWSGAVKHPSGWYALLYLADPDDIIRDNHIEYSLSSGSKTLEYKTHKAGTWQCLIRVWDGSKYVECWDTVEVYPVATCTASFQETSAHVGDTIHADFTWSGAVKHPSGWYALLYLADPDDIIRDNHIEYSLSSGSKTLEYKTHMAGTWQCLIEVWDGSKYIQCWDTVVVSVSGDVVLGKGITCNTFIGCDYWVKGDCTCGDEGPEVTSFDIDEYVVNYTRFDGEIFIGDVMKQEWWFNGEARWYTEKTATQHYTNFWCGWSWWDIGQSYGSGTGHIRSYLNGVELGRTNNYTIVGSDAIGSIVFDQSTFYKGPFAPGTHQLIAIVWCENIGTETGTIYIKNFIDGEEVDSYSHESVPGVPWNCCNFYWDIPENAFTAGIKVWGEGELEPTWGSMQTKIFKIRP